MTVTVGEPRRLGVPESEAAVAFGEGPRAPRQWSGRRLLFHGGREAFELSFWCGTCPLLFQREEGAVGTLPSRSLSRLRDRLAGGVAGVDEEVLGAFGSLLPAGDYRPMLVRARPRLVAPSGEGDYFSHQQLATWGVDDVGGLPENPRTPYYRTFETAVDLSAHLYEFVVPMVPPHWNERERVEEYTAAMGRGRVPTAVAVSLLDVCEPADDEFADDYYAHWGLVHFLLDGHHKLNAAAHAGAPVRLLSLLSLAASLATTPELDRVATLRSQPARSRATMG